MPRPSVPFRSAAALALILLAGCAQSHTPTTHPTTSPALPPAVLATLTQLQTLNAEPPAISGTFTWTTTQDRSAHFAEQIFSANPPLEYLSAAAKSPSKESPETIALRNYARDMLKQGAPQGTHTEILQYEQRQQGRQFLVSRTWTADARDYLPPVVMAWNGESGLRYEPTLKWAQSYTSRDDMMVLDGSPAAVRYFSFRLPFPNLTGQVTTRHETLGGESILILHEDLPTLYREYYLSTKEGYLPRRILQRMKQKQSQPRRDLTITVERASADPSAPSAPSAGPTRTEIIIPAAPLKYLDWDHGTWDSDTTVTAFTRRPDGQWFITESRTTYPFFRRTETFKAENLSFAPLPATAFEIHLPPDVPRRAGP